MSMRIDWLKYTLGNIDYTLTCIDHHRHLQILLVQ